MISLYKHGTDRVPHVFTADRLNDIIWGCPKQFGDDGELVDVILPWEKGLPFQHLGENASCTPNVHLHVIFLPGEHDLWCSVIPGRNIAGHLWILYPGEAEVADLQVAIFVDKDVAWLEITVDYTGRMNVFQTSLVLSAPVLL